MCGYHYRGKLGTIRTLSLYRSAAALERLRSNLGYEVLRTLWVLPPDRKFRSAGGAELVTELEATPEAEAFSPGAGKQFESNDSGELRSLSGSRKRARSARSA